MKDFAMKFLNSRFNPFFIPEPVPEEGLPFKNTTNDPKTETWEKWDERAKKNYPVRFWLSNTIRPELYRLFRVFWKEPLYWLRAHTYSRYHIIDCRNKRNGYAWGWMDRSDLLLYAAFAVLVDFVENEYPGMVDWEWEGVREKHKEFMALYRWWTVERKEYRDAYEKLSSIILEGWPEKRPSKESFERLLKAEEDLEKKDQEMLHRLVEVRSILWT